MYITKSDYVLWRECPHNVWIKKHKPEVYNNSPLSEFELHLIESGNMVEEFARKRFPGGILIEGRGEPSLNQTQTALKSGAKTIYQASFSNDKLFAAVDILMIGDNNELYIYEVKASNSSKPDEEVEEEEDININDPKEFEKYKKKLFKDPHLYDLAFQVYLARKAGYEIAGAYLVRLNKHYTRNGDLNLEQLFNVEDVSLIVDEVQTLVYEEVQSLVDLIVSTVEPEGPCMCIYKGRSRHCTTFKHHNNKVLGDAIHYGVHDLTRVGSSKAKLEKLIDEKIFDILEVPDDHDFGPKISKQIEVHKNGKAHIDHDLIREELSNLVFPLYFVDYESFNPAIPRFNGFRSYQQIPFEFSLDRLDSPEGQLAHSEFLYIGKEDPTLKFVQELEKNIGTTGSIIVWNRTFEESHINKHIAIRLPQYADFISQMNSRIFDLMTIFSKHLHLHPDFHGSASIKKVLPVLCPELSYEELDIGNGSEAMNTWNRLVTTEVSTEEQAKIEQAMYKYCALDTYAMYSIWKHLTELVK